MVQGTEQLSNIRKNEESALAMVLKGGNQRKPLKCEKIRLHLSKNGNKILDCWFRKTETVFFVICTIFISLQCSLTAAQIFLS